MGVEVGGDRDLGVSKPLGDNLHLHPCGQGEAGVRVPQIMEADGRESRVRCHGLKVSGGVLRAERTTVLTGENQTGVIPGGAPGDTFETLGLLVAAVGGS